MREAIIRCDATAEDKDPSEMRLSALKAELDARGVAWRGVCFEKEQLVAALKVGRNAKSPSGVSEAVVVNGVADAAHGVAQVVEQPSITFEDAYSAALESALKMKVKDLRTELARRQVKWADLFEKQELAARLADALARAALFSKSGALIAGCACELTEEELGVEMQDDRTPLIVDVFAAWCGPCKLLAPQLEALAAELGDRARVAKLDSDAHPVISTKLRVAGLPTVIFYKGGQEVHRLEGVPPAAGGLRNLARLHLGV